MIAKMLKIEMVIPKSSRNDFMTWLQEQEVMHITEEKKANKEAAYDSEIDANLAQIQFALEFIERVRGELGLERKKSWRDILAGKPMAPLASLEQTLQTMSIDKIDGRIHKLSDELAKIAAREQEIKEILQTLMPWRNLATTGADMKGTREVNYVLLTVSLQEDMLLKRALTNIATLAWREVNRIATKKEGSVYLEVLVHKTVSDKLKEVLGKTSAEIVTLHLPDDMMVEQYVKSLQQELKRGQKRYKALLENGKRFIKQETKLKFAYDGLLHRQERIVAEQKGRYLSRMIVLSGWIPAYVWSVLKKALDKEYPQVAVEIDNHPKEEPPVVLKNSKIMEPFEAITNIYGRPKPTELDPTGPLSIFFLVAFALALTDAGYGIVMMVLMGAADKYLRLKRGVRRMVNLLFYAGAATMVAGALTGGWFGINLESLPPGEIRDALLSLKVIDPISSPMTLLLVAFTVGIVQLLFAWLVKAYDHARQKQYVAMFFDDIAWFLLVSAVLLWAGSTRGLIPETAQHPLLWMIYALLGVIVLTGGRSFKNPLLKLGGGILSLYGLVSFLSDVLSYSRLLALGLATGIIALVVNMIGGMVVAVPVIGWLLAVIVLLGGHVFNLGINALGAFIHSGRLQFVEFFPKFLEGGGKAYRPLGRVSKYVDNPKEFV